MHEVYVIPTSFTIFYIFYVLYTDGAGLFYTTQQPQTLSTLRQYVLHLLFAPPAPSAVLGNSDVPIPARNTFPFRQRPNILDRDRVLVPAGWDSWGKIAVLREGFDAKLWGEAWEHDLDGNDNGARDMFKALVGGDQVPKVGIWTCPHGGIYLFCHIAKDVTSFNPTNSRSPVPCHAL